ncbi:MAG: sigma-70 family RNA polymerase sigma factor [Phaeodactylibacter sp.]|nr:sigma-70 family RNA polymerase sigma factor [Phaeodactylibacter sp.]
MDKHYSEDEQLLLQIKNGDQQMLKALYQEYWQAFRLFAAKAFGLDEEDALDAYSKAFTAFYFNIRDEKLCPPLESSLRTYFFAVGKNHVLKHFGDTYRKKVNNLEDYESLNILAHEPEVSGYFDLEWQKELVRRLLDEVGENCKKILVLSFIEENADDAIAEKMNIPTENAVRQRRFQCLEKLRKMMRKAK